MQRAGPLGRSINEQAMTQLSRHPTSGDSATSMTRMLLGLHRRVREAVANGIPDAGGAVEDPTGKLNPKGDVRQAFDVIADEAIHRELETLCSSGVVLSEERSGVHTFGPQPPRYRFIVDPVDGSDNHGRGLPLSAVSIAVLEGVGELAVGAVEHALVGDIDEDEAFQATRRRGAWQGRTRLHTSGVRRIAEAFISCELNHWAPGPPLAAVLRNCRGVRSYGCASRAITLVARGALDAHIDIRNRLTPESFLGASLILTEAGGHLCGLDGTSIGPFRSIRESTVLIAAAGRDLAMEIVAALS